MLAQRERREQRAKICQPQAADDHPGETAIRMGQPPAQWNTRRLVRRGQKRAPDEQLILRIVFLRLEVVPRSEIARARDFRARIDGDLAGFVHHVDEAELRGRGGMIEQDHLTQFGVHFGKAGQSQGSDHPL